MSGNEQLGRRCGIRCSLRLGIKLVERVSVVAERVVPQCTAEMILHGPRRMDMALGEPVRGVPQVCGDDQLREAKTAGEASEGVAQRVLRYARELGALADAVQDADVPPGTAALVQVPIARRMRP